MSVNQIKSGVGVTASGFDASNNQTVSLNLATASGIQPSQSGLSQVLGLSDINVNTCTLSNSGGTYEPNLIALQNSQVSSQFGNRFTIGTVNVEAEGNVGTDFIVSRFDNSGQLIDTPLTIERSSGLLKLYKGIDISGTSILNVGGISLSSGAPTVGQVLKGESGVIVSVSDTADFTTNGGYVIFDYGTKSIEGPVKYLALSGNQIIIDPSYAFKKTHLVGATVREVKQLEPFAPTENGRQYQPFLTGTSSARDSFFEILKSVISAGVFITEDVLFPELRFSDDSLKPYE